MIRFNPEVTWGHILQAVVILIPIIIWGVSIERRLAVMETTIEAQKVTVADAIRRVEVRLIRIEDLLMRDQ